MFAGGGMPGGMPFGAGGMGGDDDDDSPRKEVGNLQQQLPRKHAQHARVMATCHNETAGRVLLAITNERRRLAENYDTPEAPAEEEDEAPKQTS